MKTPIITTIALAASAALFVAGPSFPRQTFAQDQTEQAAGSQEEGAAGPSVDASNQAVDDAANQQNAPEPLTAPEMEVLVARIALYPDDLVAAIVAASLYPLQIVQAERYLAQVQTKPDLKPNSDWDGGVISLLNYPEIVKMMNDDLDWTESLGEVVANQEKEMLEAVQRLRDRAVAQGVLKTDEKTKVVQQNNKVVIEPVASNEVYVPVYEPEMLYEPDYVPVPVTYYPRAYPSYYYPTAPYFTGFVTGVVWGAAIDWDDWGVWGGNGHWDDDVDIHCNNCFNNRNYNGNIKARDIDWRNVDRRKISMDKSQFNKLDKNKFRNNLRKNNNNDLRKRATDLKKNKPSKVTGTGGQGDAIGRKKKTTLDNVDNAGGNNLGNGTAKKARKNSMNQIDNGGEKVGNARRKAGNAGDETLNSGGGKKKKVSASENGANKGRKNAKRARGQNADQPGARRKGKGGDQGGAPKKKKKRLGAGG